MTHILMAAWEYPGQNSAQGQALVRRIGQLLKGFLAQGHSVTFLYHDKKNEAQGKTHHTSVEGNLTRIAVAYAPSQRSGLSLTRKLRTLKEVATIGDFTGHWGNSCLDLIDKGLITLKKPDAILAFSSPKGPIHLGHALSIKYKVSFFVDYQDPHFEGTDKGFIKKVSDYWTSKTLKDCSAVTIINRYWAAELKKVYTGKIEVIDHAIPELSLGTPSTAQTTEKYVYYSGNVNEKLQDIVPFMVAFDRYCAEDPDVFLKLSTNDFGMAYFKKVIDTHALKHIRIKNTGWIPIAHVYENMAHSWFLLLVSLHADFKKGIASKFYEYMAFERPIMITGEDSGGMLDFLTRHGHVNCMLKEADQIYNALKAPNENLFFKKENCTVRPITELGLVHTYIDLINSATSQKIS